MSEFNQIRIKQAHGREKPLLRTVFLNDGVSDQAEPWWIDFYQRHFGPSPLRMYAQCGSL